MSRQPTPHQDIRDAVASHFPGLVEDLAGLVAIPSISAAGFDSGEVRRSGEECARLLEEAGYRDVRLLEIEGAHPAVYGNIGGPEGAPTVLLYAHYDVQPVGDLEVWDTEPFEAVTKDGRMYGRGTADDKCGVIVHLGAAKAFGGSPPVGMKVFLEGEEEVGSPNLAAFLDRYADLLAADVVVIADAKNWEVGIPAITTSLRGLVGCVVEVRTAGLGGHSGAFGGLFPDAITTLARLLATLHDEAGNVAVEGLVSNDVSGLEVPVDTMAEDLGAVSGLQTIGTGSAASRLWAKPAISVLAVDAPPISEAINLLVPVARAKVSMRIAPGQDPAAARRALDIHLRQHLPWGAELRVDFGEEAEGFLQAGSHRAFDAWRQGLEIAWGVSPVEAGEGGTIPFLASFQKVFPDAPLLLAGIGDPGSAIHAPNESQDLGELEKAIVAEAVALRILGAGTGQP
ncbi:MAG: M20/M25/M40 family metallo-hydrolase [bacterium]|nr:M20/M25/M40 family metallo-hydrolase [Acidimicrobiia bacterium]MCY4649024.1 M20/M25/M40 family metallo-hydrolase [bacterium]